jgi:phosphoglycolate phosphatase
VSPGSFPAGLGWDSDSSKTAVCCAAVTSRAARQGCYKPAMQLVIFDCDGTIADSQHMIVAAMDEAFRVAGLATPPREAVVQVIGLSLEHAVRELLPETMHARAGDIAEDYKNAFHGLRAAGLPQEPLFPGLKAAITYLHGRGTLLGIATGKSRRGVRFLLERDGLADAFATVQTADTHPTKPHPSMIEAAMAETGATAAETLMIGDTTFDMAMARNAGVRAIGVAWGYHPLTALREAGADVIVEDAAGLLSEIARHAATINETTS